jgi:hypothetical protein
MKSRFVVLTVALCVAGLVASGVFADKPDKPPGKPQSPGETTDLIIFDGDLEGHAIIEGCCPNAGPHPAYTLKVTRDLGSESGPQVPAGTYEGYIFMNFFGTPKNQVYYVKFWGLDLSNPNVHVAFGIKGGTIYQERKKDPLRVKFIDDHLYTLDSLGVMDQYIDFVTFTLVRTEL